jgi:hypothetical protein
MQDHLCKMKKLLFFVILLASVNSYSQVTTNAELDKFAGTWKWVSGNDTVTLVLEKQVLNAAIGAKEEILVGWHRYVKNGAEAESSLQYTGIDINTVLHNKDGVINITLMGKAKNATTTWFYNFWDITLHKYCSAYLTLLPGSTTRANWKLNDTEGIYSAPAGTYDHFTLPRDMVLTKQ